MTKSPVVPMQYWSGEGADAHIVRTQGVRVVLFYTPEGHPTMVVDRPSRRRPAADDEYADDLMMRWFRAIRDRAMHTPEHSTK